VLERSAKLSAIPGLKHGFTTRLGGVSSGRFSSLNLGFKWGDEPDAVRENLRRVADAGAYDPESLRRVNQVHGGDVMRARELEGRSEADGLWCANADALTVSVSTADCVPILIADEAGTVAAAVHSGWRSTVARIAETAVAALSVDPSTLVAAIGPCIELAAFEVGPEVAEQFDPAFVDARVLRQAARRPGRGGHGPAAACRRTRGQHRAGRRLHARERGPLLLVPA
jgi:YfiH family protein